MDLEKIRFHKKVRFIMLVGTALHRYGTSSDRVETALNILSEKINLKADFFCLPTSIMASFKLPNMEEVSRMQRLNLGKVNLSKLYTIDKVVDEIVDEEVNIDQATQTILDTLDEKYQYGEWATSFSYSFVSFPICFFFGGSWKDSVLTFFLALMAGIFSETVKEERLSSIKDAILAFITTFVAITIASIVPHFNANVVILSSLIIFVPGLMLTTAMGELASENVTSGSARLVGATVILLKMSFGLFLAQGLTHAIGLDPFETEPQKYALWFRAILLVFTGIGLSINFQVRKDHIIWAFLACFITYFGSTFSNMFLGPIAGAFMAGTIAALCSGVFSRALNLPIVLFLLPSIIILVPGSVGFKALNMLFDKNIIEGIRSIFHTASIGIALVSGIYVGSIFIKPRRTL